MAPMDLRALLAIVSVFVVFDSVKTEHSNGTNSYNAMEADDRCSIGNIARYLQHKSDCSLFYACRNGVAILKKCPLNLHFNSDKSVCDFPARAGCATGTTGLPRGGGSSDDLCPVENADYPVLKPHKTDCSRFYICDSGIAHLKVCQPGLHFNAALRSCDYPESAGCATKVTKEIDSLCSANKPGQAALKPHETDCGKFYICDGKMAHLKVCHPGLHFNARLGTCDYPNKAGCKSAGLLQSAGQPSPFCPLVNSRSSNVPIFYRDAANCSVFYMCDHGLSYEFGCPARLHFNLRKRICDYEENANCKIAELPKSASGIKEVKRTF